MQVFSDKEILARIKKGEIDYFTYFVKKYTTQIYNFTFKKIKKKEDVEDIVQVSFLHLYKAIGRLDEKKPVLPYLYQIVRNEMKMFWRRQKATIPLDEKIAAEEKQESLDSELIQKQLESLPHEQKKAVNLVSEGYSYKEIAKFLDRPLNTIRTLIRRARLKLNKSRNT
ncbi:hypothetical protein A2954_00540 [Candidatus Roizmanbacteria bacterium RIFCSPLOWO2_01_FULL_37_12]|uniref:HTH luxR-type domain-containing protein n=1 Tax=Candidatus Roizmanbacteria bacterium RIFCSPLOWO2_01_FULL_37_12 TaxID=1802056 RepID=A0A1F7I9R4_9BACT|nr:MAG: hypothetical protein A3D76_00895 [Candidatus Roizmanbacteria bacterium RIFCSPHIGHO2_02_FULL_37_9b]OGK40113.1 MAG: hypothetical protein A2954_00540 [Candidatus Roizmanbacteria bacterium RIFCSPLOWO2_01_FULL_37_12]